MRLLSYATTTAHLPRAHARGNRDQRGMRPCLRHPRRWRVVLAVLRVAGNRAAFERVGPLSIMRALL